MSGWGQRVSHLLPGRSARRTWRENPPLDLPTRSYIINFVAFSRFPALSLWWRIVIYFSWCPHFPSARPALPALHLVIPGMFFRSRLSSHTALSVAALDFSKLRLLLVKLVPLRSPPYDCWMSVKKNSLEGSVLTPEHVIYRWYFHKNTFCCWTPRIADRMARVSGKKHLYFAPAFCSSWNNKEEEEEEENELKDESNRDDREFSVNRKCNRQKQCERACVDFSRVKEGRRERTQIRNTRSCSKLFTSCSHRHMQGTK